MKRFADAHYRDKIYRTNVWEVKELIESDPVRHKETTYYSTHKKVKDKKEMVYVNRIPNNFFKYKNGGGNSNSSMSESLTHELCKEVLSELDILKFKFGEKILKINVLNSYVEECIKIEDKMYRVDVLVEFDKSEPSEAFLKWGGKVAIEVFVDHKTDYVKIKHMKDNNIAIIEVKISDKLKIDETRIRTSLDIENQKKFFKDIFEKNIFAKLLSDPTTDAFMLLHYKKENNKLKSEVEYLNLELEQKEKDLQDLNRMNISENNKKTKLVNDLNHFKVKLQDEIRQTTLLDAQLEALDKSFIKRLFYKKLYNQ